MTNQQRGSSAHFGNDSDGFGYSINNDWALTGRATHLLWYDEPSNGRYLWEVGMSGSVRTPDEDPYACEHAVIFAAVRPAY